MLDPRAQQLYDDGARILDGAWDPGFDMVRAAGGRAGTHDPRGTLANLLAAVPARRAALVRPAEVLRTE